MDYEYLKLIEKLNTPDGKRLYARFEKIYKEKFADKPIAATDYSKFKLIYETGDRSRYENDYFSVRQRLALLQILALKDEYLGKLEEVSAYLCDQFTWVLPAHCYVKDGKFDYTFIDLYSAETAFYLAETAYIYGDKLSADIRDRIKLSIKSKIIDNFEVRTFWYECPRGTNWATVCAGSVGIAYMYMFPERFDSVKDRIFAMCESYIRGLHDDGVCEEGITYWWYGFGFLAYFADIYKQKYGELPSFMKADKIKRTLEYRMGAIVDGRGFPFADADTDPITSYPLAEITVKKLFPDIYVLPEYDFIGDATYSKALAARALDFIDRFNEPLAADGKTGEDFFVFYEQSQIFVRKNKNYTFLTKGGHNEEMHNHNDVCAFSLWKDNKRIVADLGSGEYTWEYFNDSAVRYGEKVFCCGSISHSVPIIDGVYQKFGKDKKAELIYNDENDIKFEMIGAYGIENESLTVEYNCEEDRLGVIYTFSGKKRQLTFRFVGDFEPRINESEVVVDDVSIICDKNCSRTFKKYLWQGGNGKQKTSYAIDFAFDKTDNLQVKFDFIINDSKRG